MASEIIKEVLKIKNYQYKFRRDMRLQHRNVNTILPGAQKQLPL